MSKPTINNQASDSHTEGHLAATPLRVNMNLFPLNVNLDHVFFYDVFISPEIMNVPTRNQVMEIFLAEHRLNPYLFHKDQIILQTRVENIEGNVSRDGFSYSIKISLVEEKSFKSDEQTQNETMNAVFEKMKLQQISRNHYWPFKSVDIPNRSDIKITPGLTSAIHIGKAIPKSQKPSPTTKNSQSADNSNNETSTFLELDLVSKVIHTQSIYQEIQQLLDAGKSKTQIEEQLIGRAFYTSHNQAVYHIDGIAWDLRPSSTFPLSLSKDSPQTEEISYSRYYETKYSVTLQRNDQPFIICEMNNRSRRKSNSTNIPRIFIPTEIAILINLSDNEREDFNLMRTLTPLTQYSPKDRQSQLNEFVVDARLNRTLAPWQMKVGNQMVNVPAKKFDSVKIQTGSSSLSGPSWLKQINSSKVLESVTLFNWVLVYDKNKVRDYEIKNLLQDFHNYGVAIGMSIASPKIYPKDNIESFLETYQGKEQGQLVQIIVTVSNGRSKRLYRAIKQRCYEELGVPSQHMRIMAIKKNSESVIKNILRQINVKAFMNPKQENYSTGCLWSIKNGLLPEKSLVMGIDVWHGLSGQSDSIAGVVSSFDGGLNFYADPIPLNQTSRELIPNLGTILKKRLQQYYEEYQVYPENIIIFRDGVGDSQMVQLLEVEFSKVFATLTSLDNTIPRIAIICANKRIHRRIFVPGIQEQVQNAAPGTIVDGIGNSSTYPNFYLVSHSTNQGTITPTHYSIIYNTTHLTTEVLSAIAYQFTHLYYNWPGSIRTPASIEYAHKLAFQIGQAKLDEIHPRLEKTLYFL